jgi:hypothetical protein
MTRIIGNDIPEALRPLVAGEDVSQYEGVTILLLVTTPEGWPHMAMLSAGEVVALDNRRLRLGLWANSKATVSLSPRGQATLACIHEGVGYYLRCRVQRTADISPGIGADLAAFDAVVEETLDDVVPYATVTSGIDFKLVDPANVLARWQATVDTLKATAGNPASA